MKKLFKSLAFISLYSLSQLSFANEGGIGVCYDCTYLQEEKTKAEKANKEYYAKQIKEIREFIARDNALTQKFVKDKNSKPFIDDADEFEKIEQIKNRLWAKQMDFGNKETVTEMVKAQQNFIKNLDIKWNLSKERKYFNIEKATSIFEGKRSRNELNLKKLVDKLNRL